MSGDHDGPDRTKSGRVTAPALRRGLDILELFLEPNDGLRVPEMTQKLGLPRATTHELVNTLVDRGFLRAVSEPPSRYVLAVNAFRLGAAYERDLDLIAVARDVAGTVAAECGETVQVVTREGSFVIYVVRIDSTHAVRLVSHVGSRLPASCTAGGKALLADLTDAELDELYPDDEALTSMTPNSITDRARLLREIAGVRERGWAEENSESNSNVSCVAAPVRDRTGRSVAGLSISVPLLRWNKAGKDRFVKLVVAGAADLSARLGARATG